ncbi:hypothetical protein PGT21_014899 [Puccinia graminis f. sp. tritici]|uniref:Uncharacterized protein n=1 Tax=Puccinia graminis f. sp. tritici TaxID=56615 RepID=A0A5B0NYE5_PUCGR|nr:hypothetical protein PGT21_014899 [Puccinia graminis f. sp. tritici]
MVTTTKSHGPAYSAWEVARKKTLLIHHRAIPTFAQPNTERASYRFEVTLKGVSIGCPTILHRWPNILQLHDWLGHRGLIVGPR